MKYTKEIPITPNSKPSTPTINCTPSKSPSEKKIAPSTPTKYQVQQTNIKYAKQNTKYAKQTPGAPNKTPSMHSQ